MNIIASKNILNCLISPCEMMRFGLLSTCAVIALQVPTMALAQQGASMALEEIVVSARKRDETLQDIPDSVSVFTGDLLEKIGATDLSGLNQSMPNFNLRQTQQPGTAFIALRGVAMQRFQEPSVAVVVDGVQLVSQYQLLQSLYDIQQIEVLRGPQGSLYGRNAIGGAINISTQQPDNDFKGQVRFGYAEGETYNIEGKVSGPVVEDKVFFSALGVYKDTKGLIDNIILGDKADFEELAFFRGHLRFVLSPDAELSIRASHEYRQGGVGYFVNFPGADVNDTTQQVRTGTRGIGTRKLTDLSAHLKWDLGFAELSATTSYSKVNDDFAQDLDYEPLNLLDADQFVDVKGISQEVRLTSSSDQRFRWLIGGYYADIDQDISTLVFFSDCFLAGDFANCIVGPVDRETGVTSPFGINENNNKVFAFFGQVNYDITDNLELTLGLRYDHDRRSQFSVTENVLRKKSFDSTQPKFSLAYRWSEEMMTYATISKGFRSGAFNATDYVTRMYGGETLWNYEVGAKTDLFDRSIRVNVAAFYMDYSDRQEYVLMPGTGAQTLFNIPKSRIYGFEAEATARIGYGLDINLGLGILDAEVRRSNQNIIDSFGTDFVGNKLPNVPSLSVNAGAQYTTDITEDLTFVGRLDWSMISGVRWSLGNVGDKQNAVHLVNLRASLEYQNFQFTAYAENLFDKKYFTEVAMPGFGAINPTGAGFYGKPRQIGGMVSYRF